jgi:hypothetical protein
MKTTHVLTGLLLWICTLTIGRPQGAENPVAAMRERLAEYGRLEILRAERTGHDLPPGLGKKCDTAFYGLRKESPNVLLPAIDACIRDGSSEELVGATAIYSDLVTMGRAQADPSYEPILLELLANDRLESKTYTTAIVATLRLYPSKETVAAYMNVAARAPTKDLRVRQTREAASMVGIWLNLGTNQPDTVIDNEIARFEAWYAKNKDRIQFTKDGKLRLSGSKPKEEAKSVLTDADRASIRAEAACVLRLMYYTLGDAASEEEANAKAPALNARCGPALFGAERSAQMAKMAEEAKQGGGPSIELQADLQGSAGYPTPDAALLAAIYAASYETDPEAIRLAEETLARASRDEIRRVAKREPASVREKAESLAGDRD